MADNYDYDIKQVQKFRVMTKVYSKAFGDAKSFAKKISVGKATVFHWLQKAEELSSIDNKDFKANKCNAKARVAICKEFSLKESVWSDPYPTEEEFEENIAFYEKEKSGLRADIENDIFKDVTPTKDNNMQDEDLDEKQIDVLLENRLLNKNVSFMFDVAKKLKSLKRIKEALDVLDWMNEKESMFNYKHEDEINHFKAILLSDNSMNDFDGAIRILRSLYYSRAYHLKEVEVLTLLASNYKRKALQNRDEIDMDLISSALSLYDDAYALNPDNAKYYEAINMAYLYNIVDSIETEYADTREIKAVYEELQKIWRIDENSWWEVCSNAEFLMLLGRVDEAILKLTYFCKRHEVTAFELNTSIRQVELYIYITNDENAKKFLVFLESNKP